MLDTTGRFLERPNALRIQYRPSIKSVLDGQAKSNLESLLKQHDKVFQGIGKIYDRKNNEEFLVKFSMKPDATPVAQRTTSCFILPAGTFTELVR